MISAVYGSRVEDAGLAPQFAAARAQLGLIGLLLALAVVAWWSTVDRMHGMDAGPGTDLGTVGWFVGVWTVMMAAMMLPSVAPTVALYSRMTRTRWPLAPIIFTTGYLLVWAAAGVVAFGLSDAIGQLFGDTLAWDSGGRWLAGGILIAAGAYELTPLKDVCLRHCRSPLGFLLGAWRPGLKGAVEMGTRHAAWCVGCCWALMASLFALGVMSIGWMAFVAALIAIEKLVPWKTIATYGVAVLLVVLGLGVAFAPERVPGLTDPDSPGAMRSMEHMGGQSGGRMDMKSSDGSAGSKSMDGQQAGDEAHGGGSGSGMSMP